MHESESSGVTATAEAGFLKGPARRTGDHTGFCEHLEKVTAGRRVEQVWQLHCEKMAEYGFDRLLYGYTRSLIRLENISPEDVTILTNHDPEYVDAFYRRGHFRTDPTSRWAVTHVGACSWGRIGALNPARLTDEERRTVAFNRSMGVVAGYSLSFPETSSRCRSGIGLCAAPGLEQEDVEEIWRRHGREIMVINHVTHLRLTSLPAENYGNNLTPRQREVLEGVSDGRTAQEIATKMGVTPATVDKHLRLARETLGVSTTVQAVLKATQSHQLFRSDR